MGLNLVTVPATLCLPLKRSNTREHFPQHSERTLCCVSCGPVLLKPHMFCIHIIQSGAQKSLQHFNVLVASHSYCCTTFLKKVRADHTKVSNSTPNSYARRRKRSFLEFTRVTFSPVAKILLVYGSTEVELSLIATQKNSSSRNLFKNFRTYSSVVGMISLT